MPKAFPMEFHHDVCAVAQGRVDAGPGFAKDFGISEACLHRWLKLADVEDGVPSGVTTTENIELATRNGGIRVLEQENEILHHAATFFARESLPMDTPPLRPGPCRRRNPRDGDLPGARVLQAGVLQVAGQPGRRPRTGTTRI